jgi:hypothetical protein
MDKTCSLLDDNCLKTVHNNFMRLICDQIKASKIGGSCSTHVSDKKHRITFNIRRIFYTYFLVEILSSILNSRNVHLCNFFLKPTFKNWIRLKF